MPPEWQTVTVGIELEATPEGLYWADRIRRAHDAAMRDLSPLGRELVELAEAELERRVLFGDAA